MHIEHEESTKYLQQHRAVFDITYDMYSADIPNSSALRDLIRHGMATEAFWHAALEFDRGDDSVCREALAFAAAMHPSVHSSYSWRRLSLKRFLGLSLWFVLELLVGVFAVSALESMARKRRSEMTNAVCIVQPDVGMISETFIRGHAERLQASVIVPHGFLLQIDRHPLYKLSVLARAIRKCWRTFLQASVEHCRDADWLSAFRLIKPRVVLAEYGPTGVQVREACRRLGIPLVVHFHGYDASRRDVLETHRFDYRTLFRDAAAVVVVSRHMEARLISLGAPPEKIHWNPCGVDCDLFQGATPATAPPTLVAMGRFVEKKCPLITISAFAAAHRAMPVARLRMIGDGPLLGSCRELVERLDLQHAVSFLGPQGPDVVRHEMRDARAFVQHSAEAPSGDCEGLPVSILEAGASGLPVISTRHAGIPEAVIEGETGILVDEHDVTGMTTAMNLLLHDEALAGRMGQKARERVCSHFTIDHSIARLWAILESCLRPRSANVQPLSADAHCETV